MQNITGLRYLKPQKVNLHLLYISESMKHFHYYLNSQFFESNSSSVLLITQWAFCWNASESAGICCICSSTPTSSKPSCLTQKNHYLLRTQVHGALQVTKGPLCYIIHISSPVRWVGNHLSPLYRWEADLLEVTLQIRDDSCLGHVALEHQRTWPLLTEEFFSIWVKGLRSSQC